MFKYNFNYDDEIILSFEASEIKEAFEIAKKIINFGGWERSELKLTYFKEESENSKEVKDAKN